jgi:hypothetical protein
MGRVIPLTVQNAEIKTAAVELKTLTVSGKQVTLAVFRQLREEDLINVDGSLNGVPWGTVNYCPNGAGKCERAAHWHVVWQSGTDLFRSTVEHYPRDYSFCSELLDHSWTATLYAVLMAGGDLGAPNRDGYYTFSIQDIRCEAEAHANVRKLKEWRAYYDIEEVRERLANSISEYERQDLSERVRRYEELMAWVAAEGFDNPDKRAELHALVESEVAAEIERRKRHAEARKAIASLPQLFIAV